MAIALSMLPEFDHEMANTRKTLERIPDERLDWKPHAKSMSFRELASHMANMPAWAGETIRTDVFDMAPKDGQTPGQEAVASVEHALKEFDRNVADARAAISGASDEQLLASWTLRAGDHTILTMPRVAVLRSFVINHMIHHRAQLSVYLRLCDLPVPALYGRSADEAG